MIQPALRLKLENTHQSRLLRFLDNVDSENLKKLDNDLENIDWGIFELENTSETSLSNIEPMQIMEQMYVRDHKNDYAKLGIKSIQEGKLALVLLAGGQGSRLGCDGPKGVVNVGITYDLYIFELLMKHTLEIVKLAGCFIPFCIMTSELNDTQTRAFFKKHAYFGYDPKFIHFFVQDSNPVTDLEGQILMKSPTEIMKSPNGNGGWYSSLYKSHVMSNTIFQNVEWINVFSVDNVLQRIADPVFLGATLDSGCWCGAKVVKKTSPNEKVGAICKIDGKPYIIEYYELEKLKQQGIITDYKLFDYGVTLNYLFNATKLHETLSKSLPIHKVKKNVPLLYQEGEWISSDSENAYKYETLALDLIHMLDSCLAFEVDREKEFAPIKNKTGKDSMESARELLIKNGWKL